MAHLPISRTRTIMKTIDGADNVNKDALFLTTRAAELFIKEIASAACNTDNELTYDNLVDIVQSTDRYEFLRQMIPRKITVREFKALMDRKNDETDNLEEDSSFSSNKSDDSKDQ
ncbi:PREDICTED: chromatin accessibility complex protein 1 isoform X1 [Nicrophorus vespilloides]|uniref:Chromatin accessibility complex protein 1 isoform X1 n=1 Tax=Nicrophorus vespilloides TaxID=110193 RepID=A0ABM1MNK6_NICVS|nr:PREDICTED: chromatin accessibility complex protein 1 isoform X1 [Nicrophorus vespilloides]